MTGERDALMRAICAAPDDDTPRVVFADWLDEHGTGPSDFARAAYIRGAVRAGRCPKLTSPSAQVLTAYRCRCEACRVMRPHAKPVDRYRRGWVLQLAVAIARTGAGCRPPWEYSTWDCGGLVGSLRMPADLFIACAGEVFALAPIRRVELLRAVPVLMTGLNVLDPRVPRWVELYGWHCWERGGRSPDQWRDNVLPPDLFDRLPGRQVAHEGVRLKAYQNRPTAAAALEAGALAYGRQQRDEFWGSVSTSGRTANG